MSLPNAGTETLKIVAYAAEVGGRIAGVAAMPTLVSDPAKKDALTASSGRIVEVTRVLWGAFVARAASELLEQRIAVGHGRGVDRGFDAGVASIAETLRTSLPDRNTGSPEFRVVFSTGSIDPFTSPTIKQDAELAAELREGLERSGSSAKEQMLASLAAITGLIGPAASAITTGEASLNTQWAAELNARKAVVDALWEEKKTVEQQLGRGGRALARFVFFDFAEPSSPNVLPGVDPAAPR